ncbi:MAG: drug/metabolite transporter (DMT)-like permease [Cryomorphaceae bacterium]|jgi:drug/metabolite transporter (DMT)-like permease
MNPKEQSQGSNTGFAIASIVIAVLLLSLSDAIIKMTGLSLPIWQMYILRSGLALPFLLVILVFRRPLIIGSVFWVSIRSLTLVVMWLLYYLALPTMPLSFAAAAYYTAPIFIVVLSALIAQKFPSARIWSAIFVGFIGVLVILRPETSEFQLVTLLPILAAILYAAAMVITSLKCRDSDPIVLVVALNIALVLGGTVLAIWSGKEGSFLFGPWATLNAKLMIIIAILTATGVIGSVGAAIAYQKGPPTTIAAFDYSYLVFSAMWGVLFFAEALNWLAIVGILAIVMGGLLALPIRPKALNSSV